MKKFKEEIENSGMSFTEGGSCQEAMNINKMNISLENWLRNKIHENEEMHDYAVATETVRCWIDEYNQFKNQNHQPIK